ncbi:MAG: M15 family metallopeptidase [Desulfovibrio sp.]|jgi:hypothetical protein|nr:M15 family metallopeptidase [Desulfovibrio sp.]
MNPVCKRAAFPLLCLSLVFLAVSASPVFGRDDRSEWTNGLNPPDRQKKMDRADMEATAQRFVRAYPEACLTLEWAGDNLYLRAGQRRLLFSPIEGCPPPSVLSDRFGQASEDQALCASLVQPYPRGVNGRTPPPGFDPGRVRNEALLRLLYGNNALEAAGNCREVSFMGHKLLFNSRQGAADALERVGEKLQDLVRHDPSLRHYIFPLEGTFMWRTVSGSGRLSPHSFGVAIDLNVGTGPYWQWPISPEALGKARQNWPQSVVDAFESEGFIWGGKWHSFDYMHFEYRPELLNDQ